MYKRRQDRIILDCKDLYRNSSICGFVPKTLSLSWSTKGSSCRVLDWACVSEPKMLDAIPKELSNLLTMSKIDPKPVLSQMAFAAEVLDMAHLITRPPVNAPEPQRRIRAFLKENDPYVSLFCHDGMERYFSIMDEGPSSVALMASLVDFSRTRQATKFRKRPLVCETHEATSSEETLRLFFCYSNLVAELTQTQYEELSSIFSKADNDIEDFLIMPTQVITKSYLNPDHKEAGK